MAKPLLSSEASRSRRTTTPRLLRCAQGPITSGRPHCTTTRCEVRPTCWSGSSGLPSSARGATSRLSASFPATPSRSTWCRLAPTASFSSRSWVTSPTRQSAARYVDIVLGLMVSALASSPAGTRSGYRRIVPDQRHSACGRVLMGTRPKKQQIKTRFMVGEDHAQDHSTQ